MVLHSVRVRRVRGESHTLHSMYLFAEGREDLQVETPHDWCTAASSTQVLMEGIYLLEFRSLNTMSSIENFKPAPSLRFPMMSKTLRVHLRASRYGRGLKNLVVPQPRRWPQVDYSDMLPVVECAHCPSRFLSRWVRFLHAFLEILLVSCWWNVGESITTQLRRSTTWCDHVLAGLLRA